MAREVDISNEAVSEAIALLQADAVAMSILLDKDPKRRAKAVETLRARMEYDNEMIEWLAFRLDIESDYPDGKTEHIIAEAKDAVDRRQKGGDEQDWFFTFGLGHKHPDGCVAIHGTEESAREEMSRRYGVNWARQYPSAEAAGVERYGLIMVVE